MSSEQLLGRAHARVVVLEVGLDVPPVRVLPKLQREARRVLQHRIRVELRRAAELGDGLGEGAVDDADARLLLRVARHAWRQQGSGHARAADGKRPQATG